MPAFVDWVLLHAAGGSGADGCASVHREKYRPLGGPDGGNGGDGGDVVLVVDEGVSSLLEYRRRPHRRAGKGRQGRGSDRHGARGADLVLPVPDGIVVKTPAGETVADLVGPGTRHVAARGGRGGLGNAALASPRRRVPGFALKGEPGQARDLVLELKSVADVALVGFPNAGKSSLIAAVSAARPKVAAYPFTTLTPNLGVVRAGEADFTVADVPGLIPGAGRGKGLGLEFLRHIERCGVIVHVVDCATPEPGRDPVSDVDAIEAELGAYGGLGDRPRLVALNKVDLPDGRELAHMARGTLAERGLEVHLVSAASGEGLHPLTYAVVALIRDERARRPAPEPVRPVIRPRPVAGAREFEVVREGERFRVRGEKPARWVQQTDFANDEAVGYLADRLARLGVEEELARAGASPGSEVLIGEGDGAVVLDWDPSVPAGVPHDLGRRGTDRRLGGR